MHVGGLGGAWFWQVAGKPFEQVAALDKLSKSGDIVVSTEIWVVVWDKCEVRTAGFRPLLRASKSS
jgi:hypothetical protein